MKFSAFFNVLVSSFIRISISRAEMPPEKRTSFMKDYTNLIGWNSKKTNKRNPTFIFASTIMIFKSTSCFRDIENLICNSISCFESEILETKRKVNSFFYLHVCNYYRENLLWELQEPNQSHLATCHWHQTSPPLDPWHTSRLSWQLTPITSVRLCNTF